MVYGVRLYMLRVTVENLVKHVLAVLCECSVLLPFQNCLGFEEILGERLGNSNVVINVCMLGGSFCEFVRVLVAKRVFVH